MIKEETFMQTFRPTESATIAVKGELKAAPSNREDVIHEERSAHPVALRCSPPIAMMKDGIINIPFKAAVSNPKSIPPKLATIVENIR